MRHRIFSGRFSTRETVPTTTTSDGVELYYEISGSGETVVFVNDAGFGAWLWGWHHGKIAGPREAIVWDLRGTGRSDTPAGPYDVGRLAADLEAVLSAAGVRSAHLVGAGLGGMIALQYARKYSRAESLTIFNAAASGEAVDESAMRALYAPPDDREALEQSLSGAFSEAFRDAEPALVDQICAWRAQEDATPPGFEAQVDAMLSFDGGPLYEITVPTLVCHGLEDPVVPIEAGEKLAEGLPRREFEPVEGRHLCFIEHSIAVTDRLVAFLDEHAGDAV